MILAIDITDGRGLSNKARHEFLPKKSNAVFTSCTDIDIDNRFISIIIIRYSYDTLAKFLLS